MGLARTRRRMFKPPMTQRGPAGIGASKLPLTITRSELLVDGSDWVYRRFVHAMLGLSAMHEAIRDGIAASVDLGGVQHTILQTIIHLSQAGCVGVTEVANHLGLSTS